MNDTIRKLEPTAMWNNFADLNAVPRPSKKEERVIAFAKAFGEKLGLPTIVDEVGNVIIKKLIKLYGGSGILSTNEYIRKIDAK